VVKEVQALSKLLTNVVGKVVFFVVVMVVIIFLGVVLYILVNVIRKATKAHRDKELQERALADTLPTFEAF